MHFGKLYIQSQFHDGQFHVNSPNGPKVTPKILMKLWAVLKIYTIRKVKILKITAYPL